MKFSDYGSFRWGKPDCGDHFKLLPTSIVAVGRKDNLSPGIWSNLGKSSQALLPVILRHADSKGRAFPGEGRLAAMAGLTRKTVRTATKELISKELVAVETRVTRTGHRRKLYQIPVVDADGVLMPSIFVDGGHWSTLSPAAKGLAIAFRLFSRPLPTKDPSYGKWARDLSEYVRERDFDYCDAAPDVLCDFAGIGRRVFKSAIKSLLRAGFLSPAPEDESFWRVVVWPSHVLSPDELNMKLGIAKANHEEGQTVSVTRTNYPQEDQNTLGQHDLPMTNADVDGIW